MDSELSAVAVGDGDCGTCSVDCHVLEENSCLLRVLVSVYPQKDRNRMTS